MVLRPRLLALVPALAATATLAGCLTSHSTPAESRAVIDALNHKDVKAAQAAACPDLTSPQSVGFGFDDASLKDVAMESLNATSAALNCHPQLQAIVVGAADGHGTAAEQRTLAQNRAQAVADYLHAHGIAPARVQTEVLTQDKPPAGDAQHLIVLAEGRRW